MDALGATTPVSSAAGWHGAAGHDESPPVFERRADEGNADSRNADSRNADSTEAGWIQIHVGLLALAGQQAELDYEQGRLLLAALREGVPARLGLGSMLEYSERILGHSPRQTGERLRVAEALEELPVLAGALRLARLDRRNQSQLLSTAATE